VETHNWWQEAVGYEVYIRSFQDTNGDGIGDLKGITKRLPYLKELGIDVIWVTPFYPSPFDDMGYDISDYCQVAPEFGTLEDFDELLQAAHALGIRVVIDMVLNHTSDEHPWFQESKSSRDNPKADWYCWEDGINGEPPNNWCSAFEGSAWEYCPERGQYYLHQFSKKQPDLNWRNPEVVKAMFDMLRFWLDRGVDGMRFDVINALFEDQALRSNCFIDSGEPVDYDKTPDAIAFDPKLVRDYTRNQPETFEMVRRMCWEVIEQYGQVFTVGECWPCTPEVAAEMVGEHALSVAFQFDYHMLAHMDPVPFKAIMSKWESSLAWRPKGSWNCYYLSNHDMPRQIDRFGSREDRSASAKMLACFLLTAPGTIFLYQGEEIGMTNVSYPSPEDYNDIQSVNLYHRLLQEGVSQEEAFAEMRSVSRDNGRTPMQWDVTKNAGFSQADRTWLKVNPNYTEINAAQQEEDPNSILQTYRKLIALRKEHRALVYGSYQQLLPDHKQLSAVLREYEGQRYLILLNLTADSASMPELELLSGKTELLYSNQAFEPEIPPYGAYVWKL